MTGQERGSVKVGGGGGEEEEEEEKDGRNKEQSLQFSRGETGETSRCLCVPSWLQLLCVQNPEMLFFSPFS